MRREIAAEVLGSLLLAAAVVGSGIMGERLADGNAALALLANSAATVAVLAILIATLGPVSGAHFNPVVTLAALIERRASAPRALAFTVTQILACCAGTMLANLMFGLPAVEAGQHVRTGGAQWLSEFVATAGLIFIACTAPTVSAAAWRVPAWIGAAYWFTASTSFANPAITIARSLTDSFSGIRPADTPAFIAAQIAGGLAGLMLARFFARRVPA